MTRDHMLLAAVLLSVQIGLGGVTDSAAQGGAGLSQVNGAGGAVVQPLCTENFQEYSSIGNLTTRPTTPNNTLSCYWIGTFESNTGQMFLDKTIDTIAGDTQSVRFDYPATVTQDYNISLGIWTFPPYGNNGNVPVNISPVWFEIVARLDTGFHIFNPTFTGGPTCTPAPVCPDFKFIFGEAQTPNFNGGNTDRVELRLGSESGQVCTWGPDIPATTEDTWNFTYPTACTNLSNAGFVDGHWHVYRFYFHAASTITSSSCSSDGAYKIWMDGTVVLNKANVVPDSPAGNCAYGVWGIQMSANLNEGVFQATHMWIQRFTVYNNNPGW